jgi:hypothetical protein
MPRLCKGSANAIKPKERGNTMKTQTVSTTLADGTVLLGSKGDFHAQKMEAKKMKTRKAKNEVWFNVKQYSNGKTEVTMTDKKQPQHEAAPASSHTPTPFRPVSFDGQGINDTDQFASRMAKFQSDYLSFGPEMAKRWNSHEDLLEMVKEFKDVLESSNPTQQAREEYIHKCNVVITKAEGSK